MLGKQSCRRICSVWMFLESLKHAELNSILARVTYIGSVVDCTPTRWLQQHIWSHLSFQNLATWPSRGRGSDLSPEPGGALCLLQLTDATWLLRLGHQRPYSFRLVLSLGVFNLLWGSPDHADIVRGRTKGQASGQLQQPAGTWVILEIRRSPRLTRPRWCWVRLRWGSCPHCRYGTEERLLLFHTTKFCGGFLNSNRFLKWTVRNYNEEQMNDNIKFRIMVTDRERVADCDGLGAVGSTSGWAYSDRWWNHRPSYS